MTDTSYKPAISQHQGGTVPLPTRAMKTNETQLDPADSGPGGGGVVTRRIAVKEHCMYAGRQILLEK